MALFSRSLATNEATESVDVGGVVAAILLTIISSLVLILRVWSRLCANRDKFWWDDWTIVLSWPFGTYFTIIILLQFEGITAQPKAAHTEYAANACYYFGILCVKTSALFFYARVFGVKHRFRLQLWAVGIFNFLIGITFTFTASFYCAPAHKVWNPKVPGKCGNEEVIFVVATVLHVITDVIILILPMSALRSIQISTSKKWALLAIFFLGYGIPLLSLVKLGYVSKELSTHSEDRASFLAPLKLTMCEVPLGIICVSLPAVFNLYRHVGRFGPGSLFRSYASSEARSRQAIAPGSNTNNSQGSRPYDGSPWSRLGSTAGTAPPIELAHLPKDAQQYGSAVGHGQAQGGSAWQNKPHDDHEVYVRKDVSVQEMV